MTGNKKKQADKPVSPDDVIRAAYSMQCNELQSAFEALDEQAEAIVQEWRGTSAELNNLLLPREVYTPGMYARDVYQILRRMLG